MKKSILIGLIIFLLISFCKTPTGILPRASVEINFKESTVWVSWDYIGKYYYSNFTIIVSEHNGVGGRVTTCKIEFYDDDEKFMRSATFSGKSFAAYGTAEIPCYIEIRPKFREMRAVVEGTDNNDYSFKVQKSKWYTLTDHAAKINNKQALLHLNR